MCKETELALLIAEQDKINQKIREGNTDMKTFASYFELDLKIMDLKGVNETDQRGTNVMIEFLLKHCTSNKIEFDPSK